MIFNSHIFIFCFLPLVLVLNYTLPFRSLTLVLSVLSYVFYGWANPKWVLLMLTSSYIDYFCGLALAKAGGQRLDGPDLDWLPKGEPRNRAQKVALAVSMTSNLGILGFFKYYDFFVGNVNEVCHAIGLGPEVIRLVHIALPAGVSFYTFVSMSYAIDVYRGVARPLRNPIDFQCYVSLFPHLIAGPIIRYQTVAEQIRHRAFTYEKFARGVAFFSLGLSKKIVLANPMGYVADAAFAAVSLHWWDAWYGLFGYAFQIYFDFSGYSDMAVGLGLMIGFVFMKNFDDPYRAESITDVWRRWHISLSTWLRDYLYVPLGGNQRGPAMTYVNLMTVMLVGGLWHGASWNFVLWGALHGGALAAERLLGSRNPLLRAPHAVRIAVTFVVMNIGWVFFRAASLPDSLRFLESLAGRAAVPPGANAVAALLYAPYLILTFAACAALVWLAPQAWDFTQRLTPIRIAFCLGAFAVSVALLWTQTDSPFLYYQF